MPTIRHLFEATKHMTDCAAFLHVAKLISATMTLAIAKLRLAPLGRLWLFAFLFSFLLQGHNFGSDLVNEPRIRSTTHRINSVTSPRHAGVSDDAHIQPATFALLLVSVCGDMNQDRQVALHR